MTSLRTYSLYFSEDYLDEEKDEYSNDDHCDETADDFKMHVGLVFRCLVFHGICVIQTRRNSI